MQGAGGQLAPDVLEAIRKGDPNFYQHIVKTTQGRNELGKGTALRRSNIEIINLDDGSINVDAKNLTVRPCLMARGTF